MYNPLNGGVLRRPTPEGVHRDGVDDQRVAHGVTPITPLVAGRPAYRDVLVVTYRESAGAAAEVEYECSLFDRHARRRYALAPPEPPQCCGRPMIMRAAARTEPNADT